MAVRYCGDLRVTMIINPTDREGWLYRCTISCPTCECVPKCTPYKTDVRMAKIETYRLAEDNPEAFDKIARSALGFASAEDECDIMQHGHWDEAGEWAVSRKREGSWGE